MMTETTKEYRIKVNDSGEGHKFVKHTIKEFIRDELAEITEVDEFYIYEVKQDKGKLYGPGVK
jgi:hypothetical protein